MMCACEINILLAHVITVDLTKSQLLLIAESIGVVWCCYGTAARSHAVAIQCPAEQSY